MRLRRSSFRSATAVFIAPQNSESEFLKGRIPERHRQEEKKRVEQRRELEIECAPSRANAERAPEAEQSAKKRREVASNLRRRGSDCRGSGCSMDGRSLDSSRVMVFLGRASKSLHQSERLRESAVPLAKGRRRRQSARHEQLGLAVLKRPGVAQDYGKAREWYQKAADAGDPFAKEGSGACTQSRNAFAGC